MRRAVLIYDIATEHRDVRRIVRDALHRRERLPILDSFNEGQTTAAVRLWFSYFLNEYCFVNVPPTFAFRPDPRLEDFFERRTSPQLITLSFKLSVPRELAEETPVIDVRERDLVLTYNNVETSRWK